MIEVADVFRRFAADYLAAHGASMPPSHRRAIADILNCRTAALGGQVWRCEACNSEVFSYHSCGNRSCPKCHTAQTQDWLERRQAEMLPVPYFHITVTVPAELRAVLRAHQRDGLRRADAGQRRGDHRTRARPALRRRHRGGARGAAHLDPAVALPPACALPGQWRRDLRGRHAPGIRRGGSSSCRSRRSPS